MDAIGTAFRAIASGEMELAIAGGVESMSRAPFVMGKADAAFSRNMKLEDTTIGWRFINPLMKAQYGVDAMPQTADNVADDYNVSRADQDAFALRSQQRTAMAQAAGFSLKKSSRYGSPIKRRDPGGARRTPACRYHPRSPDQAQAGQRPGQDRHRRQRFRGQRRRRRVDSGQRGRGEKHGLTARARVLGMASAEVEPG